MCNQDPLLRFDFISYSVTFGILGEQAHAGSQLPRAACCRALAAPRAPLRTVPARWALITNPARIRGYSSSATRLAKSRCRNRAGGYRTKRLGVTLKMATSAAARIMPCWPLLLTHYVAEHGTTDGTDLRRASQTLHSSPHTTTGTTYKLPRCSYGITGNAPY